MGLLPAVDRIVEEFDQHQINSGGQSAGGLVAGRAGRVARFDHVQIELKERLTRRSSLGYRNFSGEIEASEGVLFGVFRHGFDEQAERFAATGKA